MICSSLDQQLKSLARKYKCRYSRYADDITISTNRSIFPEAIAKQDSSPYHIKATAGDELESLVAGCGFRINPAKTRLMNNRARQEVTGLTVNDFPNVNRKFIRQIRAMLYAWEKHGLPNAATEFFNQYDRLRRSPPDVESLFKKVVKGKLDYLSMVRGQADPIFIKYAKKARTLDDTLFKHGLDDLEVLEKSVFIIESNDKAQGTGFLLEGVGIVTCAHVVGTENVAIHISDPATNIPLNLLHKNDDIDLAILRMADHSFDSLIPNTTTTKLHQKVLVAGYPNYALGHQTYFAWGNITTHRMVSAIRRFLVSAPIAAGNSGGPVLDENLRVLGVAVTGADEFANGIESQMEKYGVIPIDALNHLTNK